MGFFLKLSCLSPIKFEISKIEKWQPSYVKNILKNFQKLMKKNLVKFYAFIDSYPKNLRFISNILEIMTSQSYVPDIGL